MGVINLVCKSDYTFGDSLIVMILGMVLIFLVLALLMGILYLFPVVSKVDLFKKKQTAPQTESQKTESQIHSVENTAVNDESEDEEIAAAIIAAVSVMREKENIHAPFVIRKIKRS